MKNTLKMTTAQRGQFVSLAHAINSANALEIKKEVPFNRLLSEAQPDEKARYDKIAPTEIEPYYTAEEIANALISAQFFDEGEVVSKDNRELIIRLGTYEYFNFEIVSDDGLWLGYMSGYANSKLLIFNEIMDGKHVLGVTFPDDGAIDLYGYDDNTGQYFYGMTVPIAAI